MKAGIVILILDRANSEQRKFPEANGERKAGIAKRVPWLMFVVIEIFCILTI